MTWSMDTHKYMSELTRKALQILAENYINSDSEPDEIESAERKLADAGVYKDFEGAKGKLGDEPGTAWECYRRFQEYNRYVRAGQEKATK